MILDISGAWSSPVEKPTMNTAQFGHQRHQKSEFRLLHFQARYDFQTPSSISFELLRYSIMHRWPLFGHLDVHQLVDSDGRLKLCLRVLLPAKYQKDKEQDKILKQVFEVLEIPPGTAYKVCFVTIKEGRFLGSQDPTVIDD